jgi:hypothetical protein
MAIALVRQLLERGIRRRAKFQVTYIVHASKEDVVAVTVRLRVVAAVAKARSLSDKGWNVFIIGPDDVHYPPSEFHRLLACPDR